MRPYPNNSPLAAARIVALTLIADGQLKQVEMQALQEANAFASQHLSPAMLRQVTQDLCTDLLETRLNEGHSDIRISPLQIATILKEVNEPGLRSTLFGICLEAAYADDVIQDGEVTLLAEAMQLWNIKDRNIASALHALRQPPDRASRTTADCH